MSTITGRQKVKIAVVIGVFSLALLVFVLLFCEGLGTFVGRAFDRPFASGYINKHYDGLECKYIGSEIVNEKRVRLGIEAPWKAYRFEYEVESYEGDLEGIDPGDRFYIEAYNFKVVHDGLYSEIVADKELIEAADLYATERIRAEEKIKELSLSVDSVFFDLCIYNNEFSGDTEKRLDDLIDTGRLNDADCVVHISGEKISFDEYRYVAADLAEVIKNCSEIKPGSLQIIYYYTKDKSKTMQFESQLEFYELEYGREGIVNGADMHYIIELDAAQKSKAKVYNIVKYVYLIVVTGTVIVLSAYWVVKKVKKISRKEVATNENE